jgi:AcrR family transcriptional regulator
MSPHLAAAQSRSVPQRAPASRRSAGDAACRARLPLSRERILDAALAFIDANCLDELSMRRLGGELGVEAMSLYRYFPSKAALLDGAVCRVLADLELPRPGDGAQWELRARAYARSLRAIARQHPHLFPLLATVGPANATLRDVRERMVQLWCEVGLDAPTAHRAQCALQGMITGSTLWDVADDQEAFPIGPARSAGQHDADAALEFGLDLLLDGLRRRLAGTGVPAG